MNRRSVLFAAGLAGGVFLSRVKSGRPRNIVGQVVFVNGGSRGLGLVLAREFASRGARVAISARDPEELSRAADDLRSHSWEAFTVEADITMREEAERAVAKINETLGPIDILVNTAGTMVVGPMENMTIDDYRDSINTHFWGPYFTTMAVLPEMRRRRRGRIVNISSIGGKISVPHLLPYSVGKFALTGFSEGLCAEMRKHGIGVTTVCPGLMRTGSPRNAMFKGDNEAEYAWFSISASLPGISMSAQRAGLQIVEACLRGKSEVVLSVPAKMAVKWNALFPATTANILAQVNRVLPAPQRNGTQPRTGKQSFSKASPSWVTSLNEQAARQNNQIA